ncbi:hypothetical protein [Geopseudomonas aromaticivorans]
MVKPVLCGVIGFSVKTEEAKIHTPVALEKTEQGWAVMAEKKSIRSEQEVFSELATLCRRSGYIHAVAQLCFRDNVIIYNGNMKEADVRKMFSSSRLIRTEINTLLGLMIKVEIDWGLPTPKIVQEYMDATENLLGKC